MRRPTLLAITILLGSSRISPAQEPASPPARAEGGVGQLGVGVNQLGLGVGVDPVLYSKVELLKVPAILEELKATAEQKDRLKTAENQAKEDAAKLYKQIQDEKERLQQQGDPAAEAFRKQSLAYAGQLTRDFERPLLKVLDRNQVKRLEQIQIRADGYLAFSIGAVTDRLGLTPDQEVEIAECVAAGRKNARVAAASYRKAAMDAASLPEDQKKTRLAGDEFQTLAVKGQSAVLEARSATLREIRKVLTTSQQATFRNMLGPAFDFAKLNPIQPARPPVSQPEVAK